MTKKVFPGTMYINGKVYPVVTIGGRSMIKASVSQYLHVLYHFNEMAGEGLVNNDWNLANMYGICDYSDCVFYLQSICCVSGDHADYRYDEDEYEYIVPLLSAITKCDVDMNELVSEDYGSEASWITECEELVPHYELSRLYNAVSELCSICLDTPSADIVQTHCYHVFCGECLQRWFAVSTKCPYCRYQL